MSSPSQLSEEDDPIGPPVTIHIPEDAITTSSLDPRMNALTGQGRDNATPLDPVMSSSSVPPVDRTTVAPSNPEMQRSSGSHPPSTSAAPVNCGGENDQHSGVYFPPIERPVAGTTEPDAEPPNIRLGGSWQSFAGKLLVIGGHPKAGKSQVVHRLTEQFQLKKKQIFQYQSLDLQRDRRC